MYRKSYVQINLPQLSANARAIKDLLPKGTFFCPMVKADAYGHGMIQVSKELVELGVDSLGVALVEEGLELRKNNIDDPVLVFGGFCQEALEECFNNHLTPVISSLTDLEILAQLNKNESYSIHLKFNTGMNRMGVHREHLDQLQTILHNNPQIKPVGLCDHMAIGEDIIYEDGFSRIQINKFSQIVESLNLKNTILHTYNSASLLGVYNFESESLAKYGVRPGILLYGFNPMDGVINLDVKPVMTLKGEILQIQKVKQGQGISYNHTWRADRESYIAVVGLGYADGIFRSLSNNLKILFQGHKIPLVGTVCMDYTLFDITDLEYSYEKYKDLIGQEVTIFGSDNENETQASELAQNLSTNVYEIVSRVGPRVPRVYI